jgi:hypothetical protein
MGVSPASMNGLTTFIPQLYQLDDEGSPSNPPGVPADQQTPAAEDGGISALESRFTAFTRSLTREFASLERTFSSAMQSLLRGWTDASKQRNVSSRGSIEILPTRVSPYDGLIRRAAARHELDPALVGAVVKQESGFRSTAVSSAGAMGLMQLMPDTARELGVADPFDASQNIEGGTRLLRTLLDRYGGRVDYALAAYNAGPAAVDRYGGVPPFAETKAYVRDVMANYRNSALNA